jgi:hypothetical protein
MTTHHDSSRDMVEQLREAIERKIAAIHQLPSAEKITVCKTEIEKAKANRDYYHDFGGEGDALEAAWDKIIKILTAELYTLMEQTKAATERKEEAG